MLAVDTVVHILGRVVALAQLVPAADVVEIRVDAEHGAGRRVPGLVGAAGPDEAREAELRGRVVGNLADAALHAGVADAAASRVTGDGPTWSIVECDVAIRKVACCQCPC